MSRCASHLAILLLVSCGGGTQAPRRLPEAPVATPTTTAAVEVVGNTAYSDEELNRALAAVECTTRHEIGAIAASAPDGEAPPCKSPEDAALSIKSFYLERGFVRAEARVGPPGTVEVVEGPRFKIGTIDVVDATRPAGAVGDPVAVAAVFGVTPGAFFDRAQIVAGIEAVRARYVAAGFKNVLVTPITAVQLATTTVDLKLEIQR